MAFALKMAMAAAMAAADVPSDVTYKMGDSEHSLVLKDGSKDGNEFQVKIIDMRHSTGFQWYLESLPSGVKMLSNVSGGGGRGGDEPPYIMCKMTASETFKSGDVSWIHARPWESNNQDAERGHAVLHLTAAGAAQSEILV